ncbi:MAG TPA: uroporphyrinogen-III C-methyltransferase [Blastocatellia bacterium]|nr:uroporphyrinogen-III C-methyltransferase [Blastocatellia bacterium]
MVLGKVYLVGAGPGDPDLLTVKACYLIAAAGCVIYDHLVNPEILAYAAPGAELIYAGKERGRCAMRQETINALLVTKATEHQVVVRLKGGDPFIFGRGGEEAQALASAGIEWQVVPGVSSGTAAAAYAGIPVTHRGLSSSVAFITGHEDPAKSFSSINWPAIAEGFDTLVIFMGVGALRTIAEKLIQHGRPAETPLAVIQSGTYEYQATHVTTLGGVAGLLDRVQLKPPAIIVVGEVVRLRETLQWFAESPGQGGAADPGLEMIASRFRQIGRFMI